MTHICSSSHAGCLLVRASLLPPSLLPVEGNLIYQVKVVPSRAAGQRRCRGGGEMCERAQSPRVLHMHVNSPCAPCLTHSPTARPVWRHAASTHGSAY